MAHAPFHITINRRPFEAPQSPMTGEAILHLASYGADYELFLLHGEGDPTGGTPVAHDGSVEVHNGMHFRAVPGNANFGFTKTGLPALDADLARLDELGYAPDVLRDGMLVGIVLPQVSLPAGYNKPTTDILLMTDVQYPASAMDMFWVEPDVLLADGRIPTGADSLEVQLSRNWRRFSWHRNSLWVPGRDDVVGHLEFALARLRRCL